MKYNFCVRSLFLAIACVNPSFLLSEIPASALQVFPPMNLIYHPVSTANPEAQKSFDTGLTYIFAFNHDLAFREFERAAQLDPNLAMAYWGMALALGQNINEDIKPENEIRCYRYIQKALQLSNNASSSEKAYITALATRYTDDPTADRIALRNYYRNALKQVVQKYPEDLDLKTMYAESILDLDPWRWWSADGQPREGTMEAIDVLDFVLSRNPQHIGANHYYVHAFEESPYPERALMSARRLETLLPESGHLLHMPCHIFILVGDYESAIETDKRAIAQDRKYIQKYGMESGTYPLHYLSHNLYVLARAYMLMEDYPNAIKAAEELVQFVEPYLKAMPSMSTFYMVPLEINLYFNKWAEILAYAMKTPYTPAQAYCHYCRGMAFAAQGNVAAALEERELLIQESKRISPEIKIANNAAQTVMDRNVYLLDAEIAKAQKNSGEEISQLKNAIALQDQFYYDEPPAWQVPARQLLGFALLRHGEFQEAEQQFLKTLRSMQRNGRSLFGLYLSLKGQGRAMDAYWVEREMTAALQHASEPLELNDM